MRTSAIVCLLVAGSVLSQTVFAQRGGGRTDNNAQGGAPGGGGRGGFGGGPGGFGGGPGGMRGMMGGGAGGMMGRIASSPAFLLNIESVQKEIKLTDEQKEDIKKEQASQNEKRREAMEKMRDQAQQKGGRGGQQQGGQAAQGGRGGRGGPGGGFDFNAMRQLGEKLAKDAEAGLNKILTAEQRKRLAEIGLQVEGPTAIYERPDLTKRMNITQQQKNAYAKIKAQVDANRQEMMGQMAQAFGFGRGGPQGGPGGGQGQQQGGRGGAPPAQTQAGGRGGQPGQAQQGQQGQQGGRPDFRNMSPEERTKMMEEARKNMEKVREESNILQDKADAAALKLLTKRQSEAYKKMIGKEFDVDSIAESLQAQRQQGGRRSGPVD